MRLAAAACAASILTGCGLFELGSLVDGLGGASSSSTTIGTSASSSSGGPARFCDDVMATRCFDFDGLEPLEAFTFEEYGTTSEHGVSEVTAASAPSAAWVRYFGEDAPAGATHVTRLDGSPTHVVLGWDIHRKTADRTAGNVLSMTWRNGEWTCQLGVMLSDVTPRTQFYHQRYDGMGGGTLPLADATTDLGLDTTIDVWLHLDLEVTLVPGGSSIVLTGEGGEARNDAVAESSCESPPDDGTVTFAFGPTYDQSATELFYDNIVIRAD